jgi:DNA-directed RNA polymerase specialized sigma24 family protein
MVRPLTKRTKQGVPYTRPPGIEQSISQALTEAPAALAARSTITDRRDARYLPPEVVVHLIRHALRVPDNVTANALLMALGQRCAQLLERRVRETRAFNARDVREETLGRLYELFAEDLKNSADALLDYYEVHFNSAFATLRATVIREEIAHVGPLEALSAAGDDDDEGSEPVELKDLSSAADVPRCAENEQLHRLIQALPPDEREAILWKYFFDLKTESTDPTEKTVASLCGVSGSEIRSRLRAAYARLKQRMEEKSC